MRPFLAKLTLGVFLISAPALFAQTAGQDMKRAGEKIKDAGQATGEAAKDVGSATAKTARKTGKKVKRGTKRVVNKAAAATERTADKVKDKTGK